MPRLKANALNNKSSEIDKLEGGSILGLSISNTGDYNIEVNYRVASSNNLIKTSNESKQVSESIFNGDSLAHTPVVPGSLSLVCSGSPTLTDKYKDGKLYVDRVVDSLLTSGSDGVTTLATFKLASASVNFILAGVVAGDLVTLNGLDAGVYTVATVSASYVTLTTAFPVGGQTGVNFSIYAKDTVCGTVDYSTGKLSLDYPGSPVSASPEARGSALGTVAFPINLNYGDTLDVDIDGSGASTATFGDTKAKRSGIGAPYSAAAGESLVLKMNSGENQTITFSSGENSPAKYVDTINTQLADGYAEVEEASLPAMISVVNEIKSDFNAHEASATFHVNGDTNSVAVADATNEATAITLANNIKLQLNNHLAALSELDELIVIVNELKTNYNLHRQSTVFHALADAVNDVVLADATDLATCIALANDIQAKYNAHLAQAGVHINNDATNSSVAPVATNLATLITLAGDIQVEFTLHMAELSEVEESLVLVNDVRTQYELHMADLTSHGVADAVNTISAAIATDYATAVTLANELKAKYNLHIIALAGVHEHTGIANNVASPDASSVTTLLTLIAELNTKLAAHQAAKSTLEECLALANDIQIQYNLHIVDLTSHGVADPGNQSVAAAAIDEATAITLANELKTNYNLHLAVVAGTHPHADITNGVAVADASDLATLKALLNDVKAKLAAHEAAQSTLEECLSLVNSLYTGYEAHRASDTHHVIADAVNIIVAPQPATNLAEAEALINDIKAKYNLHRSQAGVHDNNDAGNAVSSADASDLATLVTLVNEVKSDFNAHLVVTTDLSESITLVNELAADYTAHIADTNSHTIADATNVLTATIPATNLVEASALANDIKAMYEAHRILVVGSVHPHADAVNTIGSADATDSLSLKTLANELKTKFNLHLLALSTLEECLTLVNEMAADYEAHRVLVAGGEHTAADATNVLTATMPATNLAEAEALANDIKAMYNLHRVLVGAGPCHGSADPGNDVISADANSLASLVTLLNEMKGDYNAHIIRVDGAPQVHGAADVTNGTTADNAGTADIHLNDDITNTTTSPAIGTAGIHYVTDVTNTETNVDAGTTDIHLNDDVINVVTAVNVGTADIHLNDDVTNLVTAPVIGTAGIHITDDVANPLVAPAVDTAAIHLVPDVTDTIGSVDATNFSSLTTLVTEIKSKYNLHIDSLTYHKSKDTTNVATTLFDSISISSELIGSSSKVQVVSGTGTILTKIGMVVGTTTVTGSAGDINTVSFSEFKSIVEAAVPNCTATLENGYARLASSSTNIGVDSTIQISGTARTKFGFDAAEHLGTDIDAQIPVAASYVNSVVIAPKTTVYHQVPSRSNDEVLVCATGLGGNSTFEIKLVQ